MTRDPTKPGLVVVTGCVTGQGPVTIHTTPPTPNTPAMRRETAMEALRKADEDQLRDALNVFACAEVQARLLAEAPTQLPGVCEAGRRLAELIGVMVRVIEVNHGRVG